MQGYRNYITSLVLVLQPIFLTASLVGFQQRFPLAIGIPQSESHQEGCPDSDITIISIDASQHIYMSFDRKKEMQTVAPYYPTCYNKATIRVRTHDELASLLRKLKENYPLTRIVIAANKSLPSPIMMQLFTTLNSVYMHGRFNLLLRW